MKNLFSILSIGILVASGLAAQNTCDRACLEGFVDQYMDALIAHDIARAAFHLVDTSKRSTRRPLDRLRVTRA